MKEFPQINAIHTSETEYSKDSWYDGNDMSEVADEDCLPDLGTETNIEKRKNIDEPYKNALAQGLPKRLHKKTPSNTKQISTCVQS